MSRDESRRSKRCKPDRDFGMRPGGGIMVNDYDDERTLDEEEALEGSEDTHNELSNLQKEGDMPLKDLLVMYGYDNLSCQNPKVDEEDEDEEDDEEEEEDDDDEEDDDPASYEPDLKQFYTEMVKAEENGPIKRPLSTKSGDPARIGETPPLASSINAHTSAASIDPKIEETGAGTTGSISLDNSGITTEIGAGLENVNNTSDVSPGSNVGSGCIGGGNSGGGGGGSSRLLRSVSRPQSEEEEDDCDYSPDEEEWKKTIMVGSDYQAAIPEGLCKYDDALPYENEDKMLWDPCHISENGVEEFLERAQLPVVKGTSLPSGSHVKDDEQALYLLLQCGYNLEEALRRRRMNVLPPTESVSLWSEEECHNFETGLRNYGKDFHLIQKNKVRTRSVGELVQFYYLWKKTERHDIFTYKARLEKKKYALHPGITDYMDRFLEEQEGVRDRSSSPNIHCLLYGDAKRQRTNTNSASNDEPSGKSALDNWDGNSATSTTTATTIRTTSSSGVGGGMSDSSTPVNSGPADPLVVEHLHNSSSPVTTPTVATGQVDYAKANSSAGGDSSLPGGPAMPWSSTSTTTTITSASLSSSSCVTPSTPQQQQQQRNHLHPHHLQQPTASANVNPATVNINSADETAATVRSSSENILPRLPP